MFTKSAALYDLIYSFKDYAGEAKQLNDLIQRHRPGAKTLLDVACGTGKHLVYLQGDYETTGLDLDPELLAVARARLPGIELVEADMTSFDLARRFDVVTCLFSSIAYVVTPERITQTLRMMRKHLADEGVVIVEPWIHPDEFQEGHVGASFVDEPKLKIARINTSRVEGDVSILDLAYLVGTPEGIEHFTEVHTLGLLSDEQYRDAFSGAGFEVEHDPEGLIGRGLYIARPAA